MSTPAPSNGAHGAPGASRPKAVVSGSIAQKPGQGGHTWALLQYVLGLRKLGWDVLFVDRLTRDTCRDESGERRPIPDSPHLRYFSRVLERFDLRDSTALLGDDREVLLGRDRAGVLAHARDSEILLNVMGFLDDVEILEAARRRIFVDIDPGFPQMWRELGWADVFDGHDTFVTIARNLGAEHCSLPTCGLRWQTTNQPIVLDHWPVQPPVEGAFTSVATWRGRWDPIEYRGERYGLRAHAFRPFAALPSLCEDDFALALSIDSGETRDLALLERNGWLLVDPRLVANDPFVYRDFIVRSKAELMIAKDVYVRSNSGWFSDRSVCYLASGRPVVAQDTGLSDHYPVGEGLLSFRTIDEACAAIEEVRAHPRRHARAAREIAEVCFDSDRVLGSLLDHVGAVA